MNYASKTSDDPKLEEATRLFQDAYQRLALSPSRAQRLNENATFPEALRRLIDRCSMIVEPPSGGRVLTITVPVNYTKGWIDAVGDAAPQTHPRSSVWNMSDGADAARGVEEHQVVLVNFGNRVDALETVAEWGKSRGLRPVEERVVLAIGEHKRHLRHTLGLPYMGVISPVYRDGGVTVTMWYVEGDREAGLADSRLGTHLMRDYWYAFEFDR